MSVEFAHFLKGGPGAVVESLHLWPGGPGFEPASLFRTYAWVYDCLEISFH